MSFKSLILNSKTFKKNIKIKFRNLSQPIRVNFKFNSDRFMRNQKSLNLTLFSKSKDMKKKFLNLKKRFLLKNLSMESK